jgi:hypothetical protein
MDTIYKTFAEILILHEFYYTESEGNTVFDLPNQADKINFLLNNYEENDPHITDDLQFITTGASEKKLKNQRMRILNTYSGFKIVMEVAEQKLADGTIVYKPMIPLADDFNLNILFIRTGKGCDRFSNSRIQRNIPSTYYFSNENVSGAKTYPCLSNSIPAYDSAYNYEMGELAIKNNAVVQFNSDGSANPWTAITDNGYINESDRLLVPFAFKFSFDPSDSINQAVFTLKDASANVFKSIEIDTAIPQQNVELDFRKIMPDLSIVYPTTISNTPSPVFYTLEISGNNNYSKKFQLLFFDNEVTFKSTWAVVNIKSKVQTADFNLIDNNGFLITRIPSSSSRIEAPVFEIRIKSRLAYWQYMSNSSSYKLKTSTTTQNFVTNINGILKTNEARPSTFLPTLFTNDHVNFQNLPNPEADSLLLQASGQFYKNILVSQSDMFPVEPS